MKKIFLVNCRKSSYSNFIFLQPACNETALLKDLIVWKWAECVRNSDELCNGLRRMLLKGDLPAGAQLPSLTNLSRLCGLHRNTVAKAYSRLEARGLIIPQHGRGFFALGKKYSDLRFVFVTGDLSVHTPKTVYSMPLYLALLRYAQEVGCSLDRWHVTEGDRSKFVGRAKQRLSSYDGAILFVNGLEKHLPTLYSPIPMVRCFGKNENQYNSIGYDRGQAVATAVSSMISSGKRRIGLLVSDMSKWYTHEKIIGYLSTMLEAGLEVKPGFIVQVSNCENTEIQALEELTHYVRNSQLLDGYVCTARGQGKLLLFCLKQERIKVPEQVAVIAYDESEFDKDLTQVILPRTEVAKRCLDFLIDNVGTIPENIREELPAKLYPGKTL